MKKFIKTRSLNRMVKEPEEIMQVSEDNYSAYIEEAVRMMLDSPEKHVVLLSGPSGSGKTTTALRIVGRIEEMGGQASVISMDNYFLPASEFEHRDIPRDENGNIDLESPQRLDIPLFCEHLEKLAMGQEVQMPLFRFADQSRRGYTPLQRSEGEYIIIEGIHALNPIVTGAVDEYCSKIFVSVNTRVRDDEGEMLCARHINLLRRLCRDSLFRKRGLRETFSMLPSVTRGEQLYIMPFRNRADIRVDTFMPFELSVYKHVLYQSLREDHDALCGYDAYNFIMRFLEEIDPVDPEYVWKNSIVREFIGGSELEY
ncbi:MAG: nucleoside kinase [Oscillospiraceae bacterium]|nr:nucleoside kinase [Oscillospiraceae bacterium]